MRAKAQGVADVTRRGVTWLICLNGWTEEGGALRCFRAHRRRARCPSARARATCRLVGSIRGPSSQPATPRPVRPVHRQRRPAASPPPPRGSAVSCSRRAALPCRRARRLWALPRRDRPAALRADLGGEVGSRFAAPEQLAQAQAQTPLAWRRRLGGVTVSRTSRLVRGRWSSSIRSRCPTRCSRSRGSGSGWPPPAGSMSSRSRTRAGASAQCMGRACRCTKNKRTNPTSSESTLLLR